MNATFCHNMAKCGIMDPPFTVESQDMAMPQLINNNQLPTNTGLVQVLKSSKAIFQDQYD